MAGNERSDDLKVQTEVLRAVLLSGERGLNEEEIERRTEGLDTFQIESAVEVLLAADLLVRVEGRLHPSGPATHFNRCTPL